MAYADLREFMTALEAAGELVAIDKEMDWRLEVGALTRRTYEVGAPALHFRKIKGYPKGYTILGAPAGRGSRGIWSKLAVALELDPEIPYQKLREEFVRRITSPIKPYQVSTGPCKENILTGNKVNLFQFPAPYLHDGDGGRYIGTWGCTISKDLETEWLNWGCYRQMIHKKDCLGGPISPTNHLGSMYEKYKRRGTAMPFAIALGTDPATTIASALSFPSGVNEADIAGGLRREPLQLVKCETNDLFVPASSEIVIEGVILPKEKWDEGPFGELTGYRVSPRRPQPVYRVECISYRNDPVLPVCAPGSPIDEWQITSCLFFEADMLQAFQKRGWPVKDCFVPPWLAGGYAVIATKMPYPGFRDQLASCIRLTTGGRYLPYIQICDEDIEPGNFDMVMHALVTKCHPQRDTQIINEVALSPVFPFLGPAEISWVRRNNRNYAKGSSLVFDATWPLDWDPLIAVPPRASFSDIYPKHIQEKVLANWTKVYGFPEDHK